MDSANPNDEPRRQILRYFNERNAEATSKFGKKGSAVKIRDVKAELKALHRLTQRQVMSNLTYLIEGKRPSQFGRPLLMRHISTGTPSMRVTSSR